MIKLVIVSVFIPIALICQESQGMSLLGRVTDMFFMYV
jgi:hypothetical protein